MQTIIPLLIILLAVLTQSLTGFGSGLVSMAFLPSILGVRTAVPLVALVTGTIELILLIRYRGSFNLRNVWRMTAASVIAIPLGGWALGWMNEGILLAILGLIIAGYALYALLNFKLPELNHPAWAFLAGFLAGLLGGAYSVGGPPAIIYGTCRRWEPPEFKSNLQGFFLVNDVLAVLVHGYYGRLTPEVTRYYLFALPVIAVGIVAGTRLDRYIDPPTFRKIALTLLVIMGVRMVIANLSFL
jgi:uncharacterized protein